MSATMERLARNQRVFREINERIEQIAGPEGLIEFVCECSTPECLAHIELNALTTSEFVSIRPGSLLAPATTFLRSSVLSLSTTGMP
jgi:hypothetical protein